MLASNNGHGVHHRDHVIGPAAGHGTIDLGDGNALVTLHGGYNVVTGGTGNVSVAGGLGHNAITLGSGDDSVRLGAHAHQDTIVLGSGNDTVTARPGAWGNTFKLEGSTASLSLQGNGNTVCVNGGSDTIVDNVIGLASNPASTAHGSLLLEIGNLGGHVDVTGFAVVCGTVCLANDLGFASGSDAASALKCDGHGGTMLVLGGGLGSIDFIGVAPSALSTTHFTVC